MRVKLYQVDQDTAAETLQREGELADVIVDDDEEYYTIRNALETNGRCWIGGAAAPLFLAISI